MTCIIIDDETNARMSIRGILEENYPAVAILGECSNVPEAVKSINNHCCPIKNENDHPSIGKLRCYWIF